MISKIKALFIKYKSFVMYAVFGVLTTLVNIISYYVFAHVLGLPTLISNAAAWVVSCTFAYLTNRKWVFESEEKSASGIFREVVSFFLSRLFTLLVETLIMFVFVDVMHMNDMIIKIIANVIVIILNYVLSKLVVFRKGKTHEPKPLPKGKDRVFYFASWGLIAALAVTGLVIIDKADGKGLPGDSFEYMMMTVSLKNHGSFNVTEDDIEDAKEFYDNSIFDTIYRERAETTLVESSSGLKYAKHYGAYSVVCLPAVMAFSSLGLNPAKAFMLMSLVMWLLSLVCVRLKLDINELRKFFLLLFLTLNPALFYLSWVHTEIFMFSFVVMALVFWHNKKHFPAMVLMSIAAMQNLAILFPAFFIGVDFIVSSVAAKKSAGETVKKTLLLGLCAIPGFIPVIRSFINFGTYSPVALAASVSVSGDPVDSRFLCALSYIFDPNQGMIPYTLFIVPAFFIAVIMTLVRKKDLSFTICTLLSVCAMLFAVSMELHINCGMAYIMRYNVWMLPFYAFFAVKYIKSSKVATGVFASSGVFSAVVIGYLLICAAPNLYLGYTPFGKFVMENMTSLYNPPVGIFYSRTLGDETYYYDEPVAYVDDEGNLKKLLVSSDAVTLLEDGTWIIYDSSLNEVDITRDVSSDKDFNYISFGEDGFHVVREENGIDFSDMDKTDLSRINSDYGLEGENLLVYGHEFDLKLSLLPGNYTGTFTVASVFGGQQEVVVTVNGEKVFAGPVNMEDKSFEFDFTVGSDFLCDITVSIPGAMSPSDVVEGSSDTRVLSLYLEDFTYTLN